MVGNLLELTMDGENKPVGTVLDFNDAAPQDSRKVVPINSGYESVEAFRNAIEKEGLGRPEVLADGGLHRYSLPDEKGNKRSGWYVFYADNIPSGAFGSWKDDISLTWCSKANYELSREEMERVRERQRQAQAHREAERASLAQEAACRAVAIYSDSQEATDAHPYLQKKQVGAFGGVRLGKRGVLLVPMYNREARLVGLQSVFADGKKRFLFGQQKQGAFTILDGDRSTMYLCEGYATGASIHMATGCAVAVAFDAGNLEPAAHELKEVFPQSTLVIAADNDRWTTRPDGTPWNVGLEKARALGAKLGIAVVEPEFKDLSSKPTDFNDLHILEGVEEVRRCLTAGETESSYPDFLDALTAFKDDPPPRQWLIDQIFPRGKVSLVAAAGGVGKSFLLLDLARSVADHVPGQPILNSHFGGFLACSGPAVYVSAEDDSDELHARIHALGGPVKALYISALPSQGGAVSLFHTDAASRVTNATPAWTSFARKVKAIKPVLVILDPLQQFTSGGSLNDEDVCKTVIRYLSTLAAETNASIIVAHHVRKSPIATMDDAREAIRGSSALVDSARMAYALWSLSESEKTGKECPRKICAALNIDFKENRVVKGCPVKGNGPVGWGLRTFIRDDNGLLMDRTQEVKLQLSRKDLRKTLIEAITEAALAGQPFAKTGDAGLYKQRDKLPEALMGLGRDRLEGLAQELLENGDLVRAIAKGSPTAKWLDVPDGPFASGVGEFQKGAR